MKNFDSIFGCLYGEMVLQKTDNLSQALQDPHLCAVEAQEVASSVLQVFQKDRVEERFNLFGEFVMKKVSELDDVKELMAKRQNKVPKRYHDGAENYILTVQEKLHMA